MPDQQRRAALVKANEVRTARRKLREQVQDGHDPRPALMELPRAIEKVRLATFLIWVPWIGKAKAKRIVQGVGIPATSAGIQIGRLAEPARARVCEALGEWFDHRGVVYGKNGKVVSAARDRVAA